MKYKNLILGSACVIFLAFSCEKKTDTVLPEEDNSTTVENPAIEDNNDAKKSILVTLNAAKDSNVSGTVAFNEVGDSVQMIVKMNGLTPGEHAMHIHEKGDCSSEDFKSAGGHWNPSGSDHGEWEGEHFHMGDIGNLNADASGEANLTFTTNKWCIGCEDETKNIIGKGIIIHESVDDFTTQPTGNAGGRVACGVIE